MIAIGEAPQRDFFRGAEVCFFIRPSRSCLAPRLRFLARRDRRRWIWTRARTACESATRALACAPRQDSAFLPSTIRSARSCPPARFPPKWGRNMPSIPPSAAPIISNGASTPPEVPEPRAIIQIADLTRNTPKSILNATSPWISMAIVSYPTPSACGKIRPQSPRTARRSRWPSAQWGRLARSS